MGFAKRMAKKAIKKMVEVITDQQSKKDAGKNAANQQHSQGNQHASSQGPTPHHLPVGWPLEKNAAPWNVTWTKTPERISSDGDVIRFSFVSGAIGLKSGCAFRANPHNCLPADSCLLRYSVYFPPDFNWVKGGKLPGINFGTAPNMCSTGGDWCDDSGSFRIMFRQGGAAIGYAYMALPGAGEGSFQAQCPAVQAVSQVKGGAGIDMWHAKQRDGGGGMQLHAGQWNPVEISLRLNTPGQADGWVAVTVNGVTKSAEGMLWRTAPNVQICALNFVAFFGGGTMDWASPVDTWCAFKDIEFAGW